jgi:hypothetical protein
VIQHDGTQHDGIHHSDIQENDITNCLFTTIFFTHEFSTNKNQYNVNVECHFFIVILREEFFILMLSVDMSSVIMPNVALL